MWIRFLTIVAICFGCMMPICNPPTPPPGPESVTMEFGFELSTGEQVKAYTLNDTAGNRLKILMFLDLTQYIDSVVLRITKGNDLIDSTSYRDFSGTVAVTKFPITFYSSGNYTVTAIGYIEGVPRTVTAMITIVERSQPNLNHKPVLTAPKVVTIGAGQELVFSVYATDPDIGQLVSISPFKKPDSASFIAGRFKWKPAMSDSGKSDTVIFIASDNGSPAESDTESVIVIISTTPVNLAPRWISNKEQAFIIAGTTFEYELRNRCSDPENEKLAFSLISELPAGDTVTDTKYIYTPSPSEIGTHAIHIIARDPSGLEDIFTLELNVTKEKVADNEPPVFTRVTPATDSIKVDTSVFQVTVLCSDNKSGVDSVKCFMGTTPFTVTKTGEFLYSATISGLTAGWNTISFAARDTSPAKNPCTLLVNLNYVKRTVSETTPIIKFVSPSKDTVIGVDSFLVKVSCVDDSGISSVKGYRDTTSFIMKKLTPTGNIWTGTVKGLVAGKNSIIKVVATDSSAAKSTDSLSVKIKYDNDKSGPVIKLVTPVTDTVITSTSSYTIVVKCTDSSGVHSVTGTPGTSPSLLGVRDTGSLWKISINGLENKKVTTVVLTAIDSSLKANKSSDTVYIKCSIENGHSVVFIKNDNAATGTMEPQVINSGDTVQLSTNTFVKSGSAFSGWAKTPTGAVVYSDGAKYVMETVDDTLYAIWTKNSHIITFDKNGGAVDAVPATKTVSSGATVDALPTPPTRAGYTFAGWNTSSDGKGTAFTATTPVTVSDTVFAQWTAGAFTITYNLEGGTNNANNPASYTMNSPAISLAAPTRTGYAFGGWYESASFTGPAVTSIPTGSTGDKVFYAKWTADVYSITYTLNGGANSVSNPATYTFATTAIALASPTKEGYVFVGWFDNAALTGTAVNSIAAGSTGDKAFWAKWTTTGFTISYNLDGGANNVSNPASYDVTTPTITLASPSKAGYTFGGWFDNATLTGTAVTSIATGSTGAKTFWAKWTIITYTITYNLNNGTNSATNPASYTVTSPAITLAAPTRTGFTFGGWFDNATCTGTAITSIAAGSTGDKAFWVKWTEISYTITYTLNGGTNNVNNPTTYTVASAEISLAAPSQTGYTFGGWFDNSTFTGTAVTTIPAGSTGAKTFYAKWTLISYSITYNLDGGTNSASNPASYSITSALITLANPSKIGSTFLGWFDNSGLTGTAVSTIPAGSTGPKSFWAKWNIDNFTITYTLNGGTNNASNPTNYNAASSTINLASPSKSCATFGGWYDNALFSGTAVTSIPSGSTGNKTFYARWIANGPYTVNFNSQGGSTVSSQSVACNGTVTTPSSPTRNCYTFAGWYKEIGCINAWSFTGDIVSSTMTLYAKWTAKGPYTVTFYPQGGSTVASQSVACGGLATTPTAPTRSCYIFGGWYTEPGCTNAWSFTGNVVNSDVSLYAKWSPAIYVTSQPVSTSYCGGGGSATLIFGVVGATSYQWYDGAGNPLDDAGRYRSGTKSCSLFVGYLYTSELNVSQYYCIAKNSSGCEVQSNTVSVTVYPVLDAPSFSNWGEVNDASGLHVWLQLDWPRPRSEDIHWRISNNGGASFGAWQHYGCVTGPASFWPNVGPTGLAAGSIVVEVYYRDCATGCTSRTSTWTYYNVGP